MTSLTKLSLANRMIVGMATVAIVIFGVLAALSLRQELLPSTQVPTAVMTPTVTATMMPINSEYSSKDAPRRSFQRPMAMSLARGNIVLARDNIVEAP